MMVSLKTYVTKVYRNRSFVWVTLRMSRAGEKGIPGADINKVREGNGLGRFLTSLRRGSDLGPFLPVGGPLVYQQQRVCLA